MEFGRGSTVQVGMGVWKLFVGDYELGKRYIDMILIYVYIVV